MVVKIVRSAVIRLPRVTRLVADLPADGRGHLGPIEIELGNLQVRLGLIQGGDGLVLRRLYLSRSSWLTVPGVPY